MNDIVKKVGSAKKRVLTAEVASSMTDPQFYRAMSYLPNPDPILRKLGRTQEVYDAIGYDSHVMGEIRSQHGGLLKKEWRLLPGGDSSADRSALELCEAVFNRDPASNTSWSNVIWSVFQAIYKGYSLLEVVWGKSGNHIVPVRVLDKPNRRFRFGSEQDLRLLTINNQNEGSPVDDYKFLLTRHMPSHDNPYGVAVFSSCFWPYHFKHNGFRWYSKFMQRFGLPSPIGRYPMGTSSSDQLKLLNALEKLIEDNTVVVPEGTSVEFKETKSGGHHPHNDFINFCNREMSKAITSQTLASEVTEAGSRSTAEVQKERQDDNSEADAEMVQRTFQRLVDWITELNFPSAKPPIWQFYDEKEVSKAQVETLSLAANLVPLKKSEVYEALQLSKPEEGDDVVFSGVSNESNFREGCQHHNFLSDKGEISNLAEQGGKQSMANIESMTQAIIDAAEEAESLEALDEIIPEILDEVEVESLEQSIAEARITARAMGAHDE